MKVLIVEDVFEIASAYRNELKNHNIISDIAPNIKEANSKLQTNEYDIALLDINLPDGSGVDLLNSIRLSGKNIGIIMITARTEDELLVQSLNEGADDYLQKPVKYYELISRINAVYRRMQSRVTSNFILNNIEIDFSSSVILVDQEPIKVTKKEFLVIEKLCRTYPGYASTEQINAAINDEYDVSSASIRVHIYNLKKKLEQSNVNLENTKNLGYRLCFPQ